MSREVPFLPLRYPSRKDNRFALHKEGTSAVNAGVVHAVIANVIPCGLQGAFNNGR
jgi:hypothetical protein